MLGLDTSCPEPCLSWYRSIPLSEAQLNDSPQAAHHAVARLRLAAPQHIRSAPCSHPHPSWGLGLIQRLGYAFRNATQEIGVVSFLLQPTPPDPNLDLVLVDPSLDPLMLPALRARANSI